MTPELIIRAIGTPAPQGSFFAILVKGRPQVVADNKATKPWRIDVIAAAGNAIRAAAWVPVDDALDVEMVFFLDRPKSVPRSRIWPCVRPDLDKYVRSTFDALTIAGAITDDSRIVRLTAEKRYCEPGQPAGARIRIAAMSDQLVIA